MLRIKRLYIFILQTFLPLLLATFSVCIFILLMQFVWQYIDDLVGKGIELIILAELFFYASLSMVAMAAPLAILLASLMTFGNLGEHLELLAMKASGISLIRIMKPLVVLALIVSGISFVFQNNVSPPAQRKLSTLLYSVKQKSPELEIPEGSFYKEIPGYNLYVRSKDRTGLLKDLMIYNYKDGFENAVVIVADSGRLKVLDDGTALLLTLYSGELFEGRPRTNTSQRKTNQLPYRRETFQLKETIITYDTNFKMEDESLFQNRDRTKNIEELVYFIDSVRIDVDSMNQAIIPEFKRQLYERSFIQEKSFERQAPTVDTTHAGNFEKLFEHTPIDRKIRIMESAKSRAESVKNDYVIRQHQQKEKTQSMRGHQIELYKKFTLSIACLLFFFIGAPLGAIIRKGGLGMPAVLSVIIFLLYYTLDTFGTKLARTGVLEIWQGMSLSSLFLIALGVFFTYKAVNDSVIMNPDSWKIWLQQLVGKQESRNYAKKDVIITPPDYNAVLKRMDQWEKEANLYLRKRQRPSYITYWETFGKDKAFQKLRKEMEAWIEELRNTDQILIIGKLMDYPLLQLPPAKLFRNKWAKWILALFLPVGLPIYLIGLFKQKQREKDIRAVMSVNEAIREELTEQTIIKI